MKRYLIIIFALIISVELYAQEKTENQGQSIELPDFVITGVQSIDIPLQKKPRPDLVSTLSKEFFNPSYAPESFELSDFSKPIKKDIELFNNNIANNGMFYVGAGINTLPTGEFYFNTASKHVLFSTNLWGKNIRDYEDFSDYNTSGASINTDFFISTNSSFMPGLKISINAEYNRDAYKFFGSMNPGNERERQKGKASLSFTNTLEQSISYGLEFSGSIFKLSDISLQENITAINSFFEFNMGKLSLSTKVNFQTQSIMNYFPNSNNNYLSANAYLNIKPTSNLHAKIGFIYSKQDSNSFVAPTASVSVKLTQNLAFYGEYSPRAEFYSINDLTNMNRYYSVGNVQNVFTETNSNFKATLKYQYDKYFEIAIGAGYSKKNNFVYFEETISPGSFELQTDNDIKKTYAFADLFFHLGPFGEFYSNSLIQNVKNSIGNFIPYNPKFTTDLVYSYKISEFFSIQTGVQLAFDYFSDSANLNKINNFNNLFGSATYSVTKGLDIKIMVENIINNDNYKLSRYKEKPFDVVAGVEYRW